MKIVRSFIAVLCLLIASLAMADLKTEVSIWVSRDVAPSAKIRLNMNTRNVPAVHIAAYPIDGERWLRTSEKEHEKRPGIQGKAAKEWNQTVALPNQKPNPNQADTYYSRQVNLPLLKPGVYLVSVTGGGREAWAVVNVTNLAVVAKRSPKRMLIWVTDAVKGGVVPAASLRLFTKEGKLVQNAKTGGDGVAIVPMSPGTETLVVKRGDDMAGVPTAVENPDGRLVAHWQTDRPIYRPGQTVYFKTILRRTNDQGYKPEGKKGVKVQIRDPKDNPFDELALTSNEMGTVNGKFEIPEEGQTGPYTLVLTDGEETDYQTITIAAYRKPEFKVDVKPAEKRWLAGEPVTFDVNAAYYFGAPLGQAEVRYTVRRSPISFWGYDPYEDSFYSGDGDLYPRDTYSANAVVADDVAHTDNDGKLRITVPSDPKLGDYSYSISLTVTDVSRRQVSGASSVPVYSAKIRMGLATDVYCASLGQLVPIRVNVVDLDGKPAAGKAAITLLKHVWNEKTGKWDVRVLTETSVNVPASGKATFTIPAREAGMLEIHAVAPDGTGRKAFAQTSIWVSGNFKEGEVKKAPEMNLMLDRKFYAPGDTVTSFVTTNRPQRPILLVMEGQDIWGYQVVSGKESVRWMSPTRDQMSPNAYVTAVQWADGQMLSANRLVPLPDPSRQLNVEATPDRTDYRPGDKATYHLHVTDNKGRPVAAELCFSVVDEAIYALSPDNTQDLYQLYWGTRQNYVTMHVSAPEELSGGAYQRVSTVAPVRQRFEDTAYWNATVVTDKDGRADMTVEMPGNLTSWRATVRGITGDTKVGMARVNVLANRPVMLRLATPRQVVKGDRLTLIGTVDNRSDQERTFTVRLDVDGVKLANAAQQDVTIPAKKQMKVEWELDASTLPESGNAELTGQVVAKDDPKNPDWADALRVKLRVVPPGSPEREVVGGVVKDEAMAKLDLPADRIEPASVIRVDVRAGLMPTMETAATRVLTGGRYSSVAAADQLMVAAAKRMPTSAKEVREAIAMISRTQAPDGWGWWEGAPADPLITARVLSALSEARKAGITVYQNLFEAAKESAATRYAQTNLWEHRAALATALALAGDKRGKTYLAETKERGQNLSPYARLRMAVGFVAAADRGSANEMVDGVLREASSGPGSSYVPVGVGIGWTATDTEATAEALYALNVLDRDSETQSRLARWIAAKNDQDWLSTDEYTETVRSLNAYTKDHPDATDLGEVEISVGGQTVKATKAKIGNFATAVLPRNVLTSGTNAIKIKRSGNGEAFYTVDATVYRPLFEESTRGIRVLRRYEVRNGAGVWTELNRAVKPGEPVRCTVVTWGDDLSDGVRVVEPIPAGFEYTESDYFQYGREEVRDGAVLHYILNNGTPQTFRYYLRAESEGKLIGLPATAEYLRRPSSRGQSAAERIEVRELK